MRPVTIIPQTDATNSPASALDRLARRVIFWFLGKLEHGNLTLVEDGQNFTFGKPVLKARLQATVTVQQPRFYRSLLLAGSRGLGEAYVAGWWSADDLTAVIRILTRNLHLLEGLSGRWARLAGPFFRGLAAGLAFVEQRGGSAIRTHERALTARLLDGLRELPRVRVLGTRDAERQTAVVSFNLEGWSCSEVAAALEERAGICCRAGLHCAPLAHRQLGTFPEGSVRFSPGLFNTEAEVAVALDALRELAASAKGGPS